jgi:lysozyme
MNTLKEMLIRHEGWKNKPYRCPAGHKTIGVGWNLDANPLPENIAAFLKLNGYITDEMINRLFDISIEAATNNCRDIYIGFDSFSEPRRFALIDFVFNVGVGTALKFKRTNAAINSGRWDDAAVGLMDSLYYKQVPNRAAEIVEMIRHG